MQLVRSFSSRWEAVQPGNDDNMPAASCRTLQVMPYDEVPMDECTINNRHATYVVDDDNPGQRLTRRFHMYQGHRQLVGSSSCALNVKLEDDVGEGEDEVDHDHRGDEDTPLLEGISAERRCSAQQWGSGCLAVRCCTASAQVEELVHLPRTKAGCVGALARCSSTRRKSEGTVTDMCSKATTITEFARRLSTGNSHIRKMLRMMLPAGIHGMSGTLKPFG